MNFKAKTLGLGMTRTYFEYRRIMSDLETYVYYRWVGFDGFKNFLEDVGDCPSRCHVLTKKDITGIYEPTNVKWVLRSMLNGKKVVGDKYSLTIVFDYDGNNNCACVYKISFDNGLFYIGSTKNLANRIGVWKNDLSKDRFKNKLMSTHLKTCKVITFEVLEVVDDAAIVKSVEDDYLKKNKNNPLIMNRSFSAFGNNGVKWTNEEIQAAIDTAAKSSIRGRPKGIRVPLYSKLFSLDDLVSSFNEATVIVEKTPLRIDRKTSKNDFFKRKFDITFAGENAYFDKTV